MLAHELIDKLNELIREHGNLEIVSEFGEMSDAEKIDEIRVVDADIDKYGNVYIPWRSDKRPTNAKVFMLDS